MGTAGRSHDGSCAAAVFSCPFQDRHRHALGGLGNGIIRREHLHPARHHLCDGHAGLHHLRQQVQHGLLDLGQRLLADQGCCGASVSAAAEVPSHHRDVDVVGCAARYKLHAPVERDGTRRRFGLTVPARLADPVAAAARTFDLHLQGFGCWADKYSHGSYWTFLTRDPVDLYESGKHGRVDYATVRDLPLMTDERHSLLPYLSRNPMPTFDAPEGGRITRPPLVR